MRIDKQKTLQELFRYGFWGVVNIFISFFSYWLFLLVRLDYRVANLISMLLAKSFAYLANKFFVFHSKRQSIRELMQEIFLFIATRGVSAILEFVGLIFLVDICQTDRLLGKGFMLVIVSIVNYIFGKTIVYRKEMNMNRDK